VNAETLLLTKLQDVHYCITNISDLVITSQACQWSGDANWGNSGKQCSVPKLQNGTGYGL